MSPLSVSSATFLLEQPAVDPQHPWPGLSAFTEELHGFFHGRDREARDLFGRVRRKPFTVLFGQSGLGKTSLLQAGLFPMLRREGFLPVPIRIDYAATAAAPAAQVKAAVVRALESAGLTGATRPKPEETLWEYFHRTDVRLESRRGEPISLVLVFDQFEELFTLGQAGAEGRSRLPAFLSELADLIEDRAPADLTRRFEDNPELVESFAYDRQNYRVLFCLREDYLAHLEGLRERMPSIAQNRMRLTGMNGPQALKAVLGPGAGLVSEEVGRQIVRFVAGGSPGRESTPGHVPTDADGLEGCEVEPSLLSLVCRELNDRRLSQGLPRITTDLLAGSSERILQDFYERCLGDQPPAVREFIEEELLTDSGARENMALERARKELRERGAPPSAVNELVKRRLLHLEERLGVQRVELTHDVLTDVVKKSRDKRQQQETAQRAEQREREVRRQLRRSRRRLAYMMGLAVFFAGVSGVAVYSWRVAKASWRVAKAALKEANEQKEIAQTATRKAEKDEQDAKAAQKRILNFESELYTQSANNPAPLDIFAGFLAADTEQLEDARNQNPIDVGILQRMALNLAYRADVAEKRKKTEEAKGSCEKALKVAVTLGAKTGDIASLQCAVRTCGMIVETYRALGKLPEAIEASIESLKAYSPSLAEAASDKDDPLLRGQIASIYFKIGNFLFDQGKSKDALDSFKHALEIRFALRHENDGIETRRNLALGFEKVGDVYKALGNYKEARKAYESDLCERKSLNLENPSKTPPQLAYSIEDAKYDLSTAYQKIGSLELVLGDPWDAEDAYRSSVGIAEKLVQRDAPVKYLQGLSHAWNGLGDAVRKQAQLALPVFGAGTVGLLCSPMGQGLFLPASAPIPEKTRIMQAEDYYKKGLQVIHDAAKREPENDDLQNDWAVSYGALGDTDLDLGKIREAVEAYRRRVEIRRSLAQKKGSDEARHSLAVELGILASAEFLNFQFREANADLREALEKDPTLVWIQMNLFNGR